MIYVNLLQYDAETNTIVFDYNIQQGEALTNVIITHNGVNYNPNPILTEGQFLTLINSGDFSSLPLNELNINEFKDLFYIKFIFSNNQEFIYTIGNLSIYEACLTKLIANTKLIDCKLIHNDFCKTFEDKCKNNIYYISTLLASLYRAIECGMLEEAETILSKVKENLACCCDCIEDCDYIYIKNNKYAPYHYFDNEPEIKPLEDCPLTTITINGETLEQTYISGSEILLSVIQGETEIGSFLSFENGIINWEIDVCPSSNITLNGETFTLEPGENFELSIVQGETNVGEYNEQNNTWEIPICENNIVTINEEQWELSCGQNITVLVTQNGQQIGEYNTSTGEWEIPACNISIVNFIGLDTPPNFELDNGKNMTIAINQDGQNITNLSWQEVINTSSQLTGIIHLPSFDSMLQTKTAQQIFDGLTSQQITELQALIC